MSDSRKRLQVYLEPEEYQQLKEWSQDSGKSMSELARTAVMEYTDQDRLERIEGKVDELLSLAENSEHTHTTQDSVQTDTSETVAKMREIVERLQSDANQDGVVSDSAVKQAIEDIAGGHDKTLTKYKQIIRERGLVFEHPGETATWTLDSTMWMEWMKNYAQLNGVDEAEKLANDYPANVTANLDGTIGIEVAEDIEQ